MFRMGWVMDYPSMENYLGPVYTTDGSSNYYGYSNPQFDALVKEASPPPLRRPPSRSTRPPRTCW